MIIGGAEDKLRKRRVLREFVAASGGSEARIAVIPTASSLGGEIVEVYEALFRAEGAAEEVVEADAEGADLAAAALRVHAERMQLATREQHLADRFTSAHPEVAIRTVPAAAGDVHDLDGLRVMGEELTGPDGDTPTGTPRTRVLPARRG